MCRKIDCYIQAFSALTPATSKQKPLLLLAVLDLIAEKKINREFIEPSSELAETYAGYWQHVEPVGSKTDLAIPFCNMDQEPFWNLALRHGVTSPFEGEDCIKRFKELYLGARIDNELFKLCLMEPLRKKLRDTLIAAYIDPAIQSNGI